MTRKTKPQQTAKFLRTLRAGGVEFVLVGGVAAVMHGSTRMTSDLDIAMPFSRENLGRLLDALREYQPVHATRMELSLLDEPLDRLTGFRMLLIETDLGRLDAMPGVEPLGDYSSLKTVEKEVFGETCKVLAIDELIRVKLHVARPKDIEVAHELKAIRDRLKHESE